MINLPIKLPIYEMVSGASIACGFVFNYTWFLQDFLVFIVSTFHKKNLISFNFKSEQYKKSRSQQTIDGNNDKKDEL